MNKYTKALQLGLDGAGIAGGGTLFNDNQSEISKNESMSALSFDDSITVLKDENFRLPFIVGTRPFMDDAYLGIFVDENANVPIITTEKENSVDNSDGNFSPTNLVRRTPAQSIHIQSIPDRKASSQHAIPPPPPIQNNLIVPQKSIPPPPPIVKGGPPPPAPPLNLLLKQQEQSIMKFI